MLANALKVDSINIFASDETVIIVIFYYDDYLSINQLLLLVYFKQLFNKI